MVELAQNESNEVVSHFFRHEYAKAIAFLTRKFGTGNIELIEDAIQDAMIKAMNNWAFNSIPENPTGWMIRVASNRLIDLLKRATKSSSIDEYENIQEDWISASDPSAMVVMEEELEDDQLKMIFACCDPVLSEKSQIILTLKLMCGFSKNEIAHALLLSPDAVAKAFTRAKEKLKTRNLHLLSPSPTLVKKRLDVVLKVIYLLFNEGYKPTTGDSLINQDVSFEAIRLTHFVIRNKYYNLPHVNALMALMYLQSSRFNARVDATGNLIPLEEQDRKLWDKRLIEEGIFYLTQASNSNLLTQYHVQATIAAYHCTSKSYEETEWQSILKLYDYHVMAYPSPIAALNRCVAFAEVHGATLALNELKRLNADEKLDDYYLYHAIKGKLHADSAEIKLAIKEWEIAMQFTDNSIEKNYLQKLLEKYST